MKTINSGSMVAATKKAFIFGLASLLLVACGKSKNNTISSSERNPTQAVHNPFNGNTIPGSQYNGNLNYGTNCNRVDRVFSYANGQLIPAQGQASGYPLATYVGEDLATGDTITFNDYGNNNTQVILGICRSGDQYIDNILLNSQPQVSASFSGDLNVPNKQQCPGRINSGDIMYGQHPVNGLPIVSRFQPPQQCR